MVVMKVKVRAEGEGQKEAKEAQVARYDLAEIRISSWVGPEERL